MGTLVYPATFFMDYEKLEIFYFLIVLTLGWLMGSVSDCFRPPKSVSISNEEIRKILETEEYRRQRAEVWEDWKVRKAKELVNEYKKDMEMRNEGLRKIF